MDLSLLDCNVSDLIDGENWIIHHLIDLFGLNASHLIPNLGQIDHSDSNFWVWGTISQNCKISTSTYHFLNYKIGPTDVWVGWSFIWSLKVAPRIKLFIWMTFHGRIKY